MHIRQIKSQNFIFHRGIPDSITIKIKIEEGPHMGSPSLILCPKKMMAANHCSSLNQ